MSSEWGIALDQMNPQKTLARLGSLWKTLGRGGSTTNVAPPEVEVPVVAKIPYELGKQIGSGGAGKVAEARKTSRFSKTSSYKYAVKICKIESVEEMEERKAREEKEKEELGEGADEVQNCEGAVQGQVKVPRNDLMSELKVLSHLQSKTNKHIIKLVECFETVDAEQGNRLWIITNCMTTSLEHIYEKALFTGNKVGQEFIAFIGQEIAKALQFLELRRVVHLDLKPGNVLLSLTGAVKLCDFGLSVIIPEGQSKSVVKEVRGTLEFMASELLDEGNEFDFQADVWSLAVILSHLGTNNVIPCGFISELSWKDYKESNIKYFYSMLGADFLSKQEHAACHPVTSESGKRNAIEAARQYEAWRDFAHLIRGCLIPLPAKGPNDEVTRTDIAKRSSLTHVLSWASTVLQNVGELSLQQTLLRHIRDSSNLVIGGSNKPVTI